MVLQNSANVPGRKALEGSNPSLSAIHWGGGNAGELHQTVNLEPSGLEGSIPSHPTTGIHASIHAKRNIGELA